MQKNSLPLYCFLVPVLLLGLSLEISAQNIADPASVNSSESTLNRLIGISHQLSTLNEKLHSELQNSRRNSMELQTMLAESKQELEELKNELEVLRSDSTELLIKAESSQTELTVLQEALRKAGSSLMSLELSFALYREEAEKKIRSLSRENKLWKWSFIGASVIAAGMSTAFLFTR